MHHCRPPQADSLLSQLGGMGVSLRDREKTWTCRPPKDFGPLGHDYERAADDDTPFDEATLAKINELLAQRLQAKLTRAFDEADGCMDELQAIGVFVNDKLRGWRADGGAFPTHARIEGDGDAAWPYADEARLGRTHPRASGRALHRQEGRRLRDSRRDLDQAAGRDVRRPRR